MTDNRTPLELLSEALASASITPTDRIFNEAAVMLAPLILETTAEDIVAEALEFDIEFVRLVASRLRSSEIWAGDGINAIHREIWDSGDGVALVLDVNVAAGDMKSFLKDGEPRYQMTDSGKQHVETLVRRNKKDRGPRR